jgi:predicted glycogen debranching enzyme
MDEESGLIFSPAHFTWMDTDHPAGSPRQGYPIEIQALWYFALGILSRIDSKSQTKKWQLLAEQVEESIKTFYMLNEERFLSDCLHTNEKTFAAKAVPDDSLRPNQLLTITLGGLTDPHLCREVVESCMCLLVPGGIRSLADRPVKYPLEIHHQQRLLVDPFSPYQGKYIGDEDTCRKPAYHNGTAWTWIFPVFCEAWSKVFGSSAKATAMDWLASSTRMINEGCLGHVPEILDGNYPHTQRGCDAQAWGASEILRVWKLLSNIKGQE